MCYTEMDPLFRQHMQELADKQGSCKKSSAISETRYAEIVQHLTNPEDKVNPHLKSWVKIRKFQLIDLPALGLEQVLVIPNDKANKVSFFVLSVGMIVFRCYTPNVL